MLALLSGKNSGHRKTYCPAKALAKTLTSLYPRLPQSFESLLSTKLQGRTVSCCFRNCSTA